MSERPELIVDAPQRTVILVLRHSEVHNPQDIVYARLPRYGLSAHGREQAERSADFLAVRPVAALYSSPLLRARQTAAIVARRHPHLRVRFSRSLIEVRTGYQGRPNSILKAGFSFYEPPADPADETMAAVLQRLLVFVRTVMQRHAGQSVVLVSHADPIAILRLGLEGRELTAHSLHHTVYPARSSLTQVVLEAGAPPRLTYFDLAGEGPT